MVKALTSDLDRGRLLFANPALAFKDAGVQLSPAVADHILHTLRHSPETRTRREQLTALLKEQLGVAPHPSDGKWLAGTLFERLGLGPLRTFGHQPAYLPAIPADAEEQLRGLLPPSSRPRLPARAVRARRQALWRLDLDTEVPTLPATKRVPKQVTLEELWFYLGRHELVRPLLELGIIERSTMPVLGATAFRRVKAGEPTNGFVDWIDDVSFPSGRAPRRRQPP